MADPALWAVVGTVGGRIAVSLRGATEQARHVVDGEAFAALVTRLETAHRVRWVWSDTAHWYRLLLADGVRVARCHDLRLNHAILRDTMLVHAPDVVAATAWDLAPDALPEAAPALFDLEAGAGVVQEELTETLAEFERQRVVLDAADGRLRLLTVAESAGALVAAEMRAAGLPWSVAVHEQILEAELGDRLGAGGVPRRIAEQAVIVRGLLGDPRASLDSQPKLLRALHRVGVQVESTSKWDLAEHTHPVIAPLLAYKRMMRLLSANGWAWLQEWVRDGRFRPVYVPGGVVTGRWASSGGGALQLPRQLRPAVCADPGWKLVVADVAQLEPRVLAAMSGDLAMAHAARGADLYAGLVSAGVVASRHEAKIAVLGAMYGATTGESGRLVPRLRRAFPAAMRLVDDAAATGERGGMVATVLGRTSPPPSPAWLAAQARASDAGASERDEQQARRWARERGRFTRNFVVQGTAAEWALAWLGAIRAGLTELGVSEAIPATASGAVFARRPHLVFFLHDEIILHVPEAMAEAAADVVRRAAAEAARLLFADFPIDFPLDMHITDDAAK